MYQNIKWFLGSNYYKVKNYLLKNGWKQKPETVCFVDKDNNIAKCTYYSGGEELDLIYTVKPGASQKQVCDKVVDYQTRIIDSESPAPLNALFDDVDMNKSRRIIIETYARLMNEKKDK